MRGRTSRPAHPQAVRGRAHGPPGEQTKSRAFPGLPESDIDVWLKTHVALVSPRAQALFRTGSDNYALARDC